MQEKESVMMDSAALRQLQERANKDALSSLLNRETAETYIRQRLQELPEGESCALFIIDLDHFKQVNDQLGHQAGDLAIQQAAQILSGLFRATDILGRLGGDEFIVFLSGRITEKLVRDKAELICQRLQITLNSGASISLSASVGVHLSFKRAPDFSELYHSADMALYQVKNQKRGGFCLHTDGDARVHPTETVVAFNSVPLTSLLECMDSGVALVEAGRPLQMIYVSPSFCRLMGTDVQSFTLPRPLGDVVHPDDMSELENVLRQAAEQDSITECTCRIARTDGRWMWWRIRTKQLGSGGPNPVMLVTTTDISAYKEKEDHLQQANERLRLAFSQTTQILWEVDVARRRVSVFDSNGKPTIAESTNAKFPESLIGSGWVHADSVSRFREFADELLGGKTQGYGNFIVRYQETGCYRWVAMSYRMLFDETGRAVKAVGIMEDLFKVASGETTRSVIKRPLPETLVPDLILGLCANLSRDSLRNLWIEGRDMSGGIGGESCTQLLAREEKKVFSDDDRKALQVLFSRDLMLRAFEEGKQWLSAEYRRADGSGSIRWVYHVINLVEDPLTHEVYLFTYLSLADRRHHWEDKLENKPVRDTATGLYDRATTRAMVESILHSRRSGTCALAVIRLCGLSKLQAAGSSEMNRERHYIAIALSVSLGSNCVIGRYSRDELIVFYPEARVKADLRRQIENAFAFVRLVLTNVVRLAPVRFVAGAVYGQGRSAAYSEMLFQATQVCTLWQNAAVDIVAFPHEDDDWAWTEIQKSVRDDRISVYTPEMHRPLSEQEKQVAYDCIAAMLEADSLEGSVKSVLRNIGQYYEADRVYLLRAGEGRRIVTMPYEWTNLKKRSIQQAVTGMPFERFPLLARCMQERAPVFLTREKKNMLRLGHADEEVWHYTAVPMVQDDLVDSFLCIENPHAHVTDAALFNTLVPHMLRERQRFQGRKQLQDEGRVSDALVEMPNLRDFTNTIGSLTSDQYSSLGAVCLDVPGWSAINSTLGFEYGNRLLSYIYETMSEIFGNGFLFRTWDAEFVVLSPNITQQVFSGRCVRLGMQLRRRYPQEVRIGHTWSDGVFDGKKLVEEARTIMHCEHPETQHLIGNDYPNVGAAAKDGRFTVFFQPQVDIRTGNLVGAEALVRGVDDAGKIVLPGTFIEALEKNGGIRDLDLFVLDRTLAQMDRWREQGMKLVPVSVNFSRITLFDSSIVASILAIQSRYPELPDGLLEVEITESAGNAEKVTLNAIMEQLHEFGIRFGLDDFGSKYANISAFTNVKFDTVKLDRSLVAGLSGNEIGRMMVKDITRICKKQGMACVAEGVENEAQLTALKAAGCMYAQGFYYDRPLPAKQFARKYLQPAAQGENASKKEESL